MDDFIFFMGYDIAHESGHTLGLVHTLNKDPSDVMSCLRNWNSYPRTLSFRESQSALELGLDQTATVTRLTNALQYYTDERPNYGSGRGLFQGIDAAGTPPLPSQAMTLTDDRTGNLVLSTLDFGTVDGSSGLQSDTLDLTNYGTGAVTLASIGLVGDPAFSPRSEGFAGELEPGHTRQFEIRFAPGLGPKTATLSLQATAQQTPIGIHLAGRGTVAGPAAQVDTSGNNLGGAVIGHSVTKSNALVINNFGSSPLTITGVQFLYGGTSFSVDGLPTNLATNPITIAPNGSYSLSVTFAPSQAELERGLIQLTTNDPANPTIKAGVVGTGVFADNVGFWGNDYVAISFPKLGDDATIRLISDSAGHFDGLPRDTKFDREIPTPGLIASRPWYSMGRLLSW